MRARPEPLTFEELCYLLGLEEINLTYEMNTLPVQQSPDQSSAFATHINNFSSNNFFGNTHSSQFSLPPTRNYYNHHPSSSQFYSQPRNNYSNTRDNRRRYSRDSRASQNRDNHGRNNRWNSSREPCQICNLPNHIAADCYHRLNPQYTAKQANIASSSHSSETPWFFDSGATNHVTRDSNQICTPRDYHHHESISVGNGAALPVAQMGDGLLPTPTRQSYETDPFSGPM